MAWRLVLTVTRVNHNCGRTIGSGETGGAANLRRIAQPDAPLSHYIYRPTLQFALPPESGGVKCCSEKLFLLYSLVPHSTAGNTIRYGRQ